MSFYRSYYGTRGIANKWFKSYSCNHTQYVSINGFNSNHKLMKYGVAHGLAYEPLIFLFFSIKTPDPFILLMIPAYSM